MPTNLLDFLLSRTEILIGLGLSGMLLTFAALLLTLRWLRGLARQANQRRLARPAQPALPPARRVIALIEPEDVDVQPSARPVRAVAVAKPQAQAPQPVQPSVIAPQPTAESAPVSTNGDEVTPAVQNILDTIFVDEEADARWQALTEGKHAPSAAQLAVEAENLLQLMRSAAAEGAR